MRKGAIKRLGNSILHTSSKECCERIEKPWKVKFRPPELIILVTGSPNCVGKIWILKYYSSKWRQALNGDRPTLKFLLGVMINR